MINFENIVLLKRKRKGKKKKLCEYYIFIMDRNIVKINNLHKKYFNFFSTIFFDLLIFFHIYIYVCVCVCVCVSTTKKKKKKKRYVLDNSISVYIFK